MKRIAMGLAGVMIVAGSSSCMRTVDLGGRKAGCPVVVASDATEAERHAAQELTLWLGRAGGGSFPVTNTAPARGPAIVLSFDPALGGEESRLRTARGGRIQISGGRPRGVLYGAYGLLEDHLGFRWYTKDAIRVPPTGVLAVPAGIDERTKPQLEYREVFWTEAFDGDWAARNRLNSNSARLDPRHGGKVSYGTFVHTFERILSAEEHFDAHPEWFSMVKGQRVKARTQLCLTHPEVRRRAIETVRGWIRANPDATIFSVSQNDWLNPCECPACKAIDDAEGSYAGTMIDFVNHVAAAIAKDHPNVAIDTLAYQYTRKPPKTVRPLPNVIVRLCSIECCFAHPLDGCPEETNTSFLEDLRGWNKLTNRLYVWDYTTDFAHYLLPFPNLGVLDDNVRTFAANGVVGLFEQGNYSAGGGGELSELRSWVLAKLLWDPSRDGDALIREFVTGAYGPAAPAVRRYLDLRREAIRRAGNHVRIFDGFTRPDLAAADLRAWDAALAEAERLAAGDTALAARVERLRMPLWYAQVMQAVEPQETIGAASRRLAAAARANKLTHFRESSRGLDHELRQLDIAAARKPVAAPAGIVRGEDHRFSLYRDGDLVERVIDPAAEDGVAVRLTGRTTEWAVQWRPGTNAPPGRSTLRVRIRIEKKGDTDGAFSAGVYDTETKKGLAHLQLDARAVADGAYRDYELGPFDLTPTAYMWIAPRDNMTNVPAIFIDRMDLVPATK